MMQTLRRRRFLLNLVPVAAVAAAFALSACGGSRAEPPASDADWNVRLESPLDTLDVPPGGEAARDDASASAGAAVPEARPVEPESVQTSVAPPPAAGKPAMPDARDFTPGWRVQIAALSSMTTAEEVAAKARERFHEPVYVEYEPPLYKVRVGDFLVRQEAESMKTRALSQDYENAWVVETLVLKPAAR